MKQMVAHIFRGLDPTDPTFFMPWIRHFYHTQGFKILCEGTKQRDRFLQQKIDARKKNLDPDQINGAIDALLLQNESKQPGMDKLSEDEILMILNDMILGSSDTIIESLKWMILYILHHPECQEKIYEELSSNLTGRDVKYSDMSKLPYLQATIQETFRHSLIVPNLLHKTVCNTSVDGKSVPKDTTILLNVYFAHRDPRHWGETADDFDPDRWIDNTTGSLKPDKDASFVTFGAGTRGCLGEKAGRMIVSIFAARIFGKFKIIKASSSSGKNGEDICNDLPDFRDGTSGLIGCVSAPFSAVFQARQ